MDSSQNLSKSKTFKTKSIFSSKISTKHQVPIDASDIKVDDLNESFIEVFRSYQTSNAASQANLTTEERKFGRTQCLTKRNPEAVIVPKNNADKNSGFSDFVENEFSSSDLKQIPLEISSILKHNIVQHCPICFKRNTFDQTSSFITHLKTCAAKNNVPTEQLIRAVQLVEKQTSERLALGLPKIVNERTAVKKNYTRKIGMDSNMQLAVAMSVSLRESEILTKLKETETLLEAGLEQEAMSSCKQLEDFGFKISKPADVKLQKYNTRLKNRYDTVLFTRTQSERERIITEKVAIVLIDSDRQCSDSILPLWSGGARLKSKFLQNIREENFNVWKKSYQLNEEISEEYYYVGNLSSFVSPCKVEIGAKLKHVSQIPGRLSSLDENHFDRSLQELTDFLGSTSRVNASKMTSLGVQKEIKSRLSSDWKSLVNKKFMSDITIFVKNERRLYAHKLVFLARCGSILNDTIKETENGKTTEIIMWMEFCFESVIAFLEYIYAEVSDMLSKLSVSQLSDLKKLCTRYCVDNLKECLDHRTAKDEPFALDIMTEKEDLDSQIFFSGGSFRALENCSLINAVKTTDSSPSMIDEGEKNLMFLQTALKTQNIDERASPEMFSEFNIPHVEENVEDDFSLSIHNSSSNSYDKDHCSLESTSIKADSSRSEVFKMSSVVVSDSETVTEKILSTYCSSSLVKEEPKETNLNGNSVQWTCDTDAICLSDDDDFCDNIPDNVDQIKLNGIKPEKRKSQSPLAENPTKRDKLSFTKGSPNRKCIMTSKSVESSRQLKKTTSSQSYSLSNSPESVSDESLCKIYPTNNGSSPISSFLENLSQKLRKSVSCHDEEKSSQDSKLTSPHISYELDDFRDLKSELRSTINSRCLNDDVGGNLLTPKSESPVNDTSCFAENELTYVSPIWDGFEAANDNYFDMNFSPSPCKTKNSPLSKFSTPVKNLLTKDLVSPFSSGKDLKNSFNLDEFPNNVNSVKQSTSDVPNFESFSVNESLLSQLESCTAESKMPRAQSQIATPISNVRKFKVRSKSDTFLTPSPQNNCSVTPMANYSGMKTCELKRELDKYGIKPGLGKRKAKQLLRHIYDKLHPLEDGATPHRNKKNCTAKNLPCASVTSKNSRTISFDSENSSDSFASGIDVLEASFVEDDVNQNQDIVEDTKSQKTSVDVGFKNLLLEDKDLHSQILLYEPIWLEQLKSQLKENNVKCSSQSLMNYLDEKCITFRTQHPRRVHKKRKKTKNTAETKSS